MQTSIKKKWSSLSIGIVGLPNVGKSSLFNAITHATVDAQNYPFCTIEPNVGVVAVPDARLALLQKLSSSQKVLPATIEFVDIAGLVKGASKGEGLGNQFLSNIRNTSAIAHVVRCFQDDDVIHVHGHINPVDDIDTINAELLLADYDMLQKWILNQEKKAKARQKSDVALLDLFRHIADHLGKSKPLRCLNLSEDERLLLAPYAFLTDKKVIYVANVDEKTLKDGGNDYVKQVEEYAKQHQDNVIMICVKMEEELSQFDESEKIAYLADIAIEYTGLEQLSKACFDLLGLQTYLTTGPKETRAWTIKKGTLAPQAAGVIHSDFEKGFIRANVVSYTDFLSCSGMKYAKEKGLLRQEGKDYIMQDGDVVDFLCQP